MPSSCSITAQQLGVTFAGGHATLADIDFRCASGEFVTIVGPSGCGKSTFLRCVAGLQVPTQGRLDLGEGDNGSPRVAFVFQDPTLLPWRTVAQNVGLPLELKHVPAAERKQRISGALNLVGLAADDAAKLPHMLSGGMRMRVSIARALVTDPHVLLLDEPFAALDEISRQTLNEELLRLWIDHGWTTLFVTHNVSEAVFLSERVLVMSNRPATFVEEYPIEFDDARDAELRATATFAATTGRISAALRRVSS